MTILIFLFITLVSAALQATIPTLRIAGFAPMPFLLGVVIYYALLHRTNRMIPAALLIGILGDSLGMMPLGFSSLCYAITGSIIAHFRDVMTVRSWSTHAFLGATANFATTFVTWLLLSKDDLVQWPWNWLFLKFVGSLFTGAIIVPLMFAVLERIDHLLGHTFNEEAQSL